MRFGVVVGLLLSVVLILGGIWHIDLIYNEGLSEVSDMVLTNGFFYFSVIQTYHLAMYSVFGGCLILLSIVLYLLKENGDLLLEVNV